jgi:hypothetical protein
MNIETPSRISSLPGKHGSMRVIMSEPPSSNDGTLDEILPMDSASFSTDQDVQYDDDLLKFTTESEKSKSKIRKKKNQVEM